jgi:hypothetical protein
MTPPEPSRSSPRTAHRPEVEIAGRITRVLTEQTAPVNARQLTFDELGRVDAALRLVLDL